MNENIKFCKDCKHLQNKYPDSIPNRPAYCMRPDGFNLVTGEPQERKILAETERTLDATGCGFRAVFFQPIRDFLNIEAEF